jgi:hypothetical protein
VGSPETLCRHGQGPYPTRNGSHTSQRVAGVMIEGRGPETLCPHGQGGWIGSPETLCPHGQGGWIGSPETLCPHGQGGWIGSPETLCPHGQGPYPTRNGSHISQRVAGAVVWFAGQGVHVLCSSRITCHGVRESDAYARGFEVGVNLVLLCLLQCSNEVFGAHVFLYL